VRRLSTDVPIVLFASSPWECVGPLNCHHLATRFAARGHTVLFVESTGLRSPSVLGSRQDRVRIVARLASFLHGLLRGPHRVADNLYVISPLVAPWGWPEPWRALSLRALGLQARVATRRLGFARPVVWAQLPTAADVARAIRPSSVVYHCVDDYTANPGVDSAWVEGLERRLLEQADWVVAASPTLGERLARGRPDTDVLPNVADVTLFSRALLETGAEPAELAGLPRPRAVYVGNISTYKVDPQLLDDLAAALPQLAIVLIGEIGLGDTADSESALGSLRHRPNVRVLPPRPPEALPDLMRHCDVGLIPFVLSGHTRSSLPLKLYEYLGAGLPVVATALPNLRGLAPDWAVRLADGASEFTGLVEKALADPPERRRDRLELASAHDWEARIDEILDRLGAGFDRPGLG